MMAALIQSVIGTFGFTEVGIPYPLTAKYHMNLCGIKTENIARNSSSVRVGCFFGEKRDFKKPSKSDG